jgi:hypothetical protein
LPLRCTGKGADFGALRAYVTRLALLLFCGESFFREREGNLYTVLVDFLPGLWSFFDEIFLMTPSTRSRRPPPCCQQGGRIVNRAQGPGFVLQGAPHGTAKEIYGALIVGLRTLLTDVFFFFAGVGLPPLVPACLLFTPAFANAALRRTCRDAIPALIGTSSLVTLREDLDETFFFIGGFFPCILPVNLKSQRILRAPLAP